MIGDVRHYRLAYDQETIPLVAGLDWAYDLTPLLISSWDTYALTESGQFFKQAMEGAPGSRRRR